MQFCFAFRERLELDEIGAYVQAGVIVINCAAIADLAKVCQPMSLPIFATALLLKLALEASGDRKVAFSCTINFWLEEGCQSA